MSTRCATWTPIERGGSIIHSIRPIPRIKTWSIGKSAAWLLHHIISIQPRPGRCSTKPEPETVNSNRAEKLIRGGERASKTGAVFRIKDESTILSFKTSWHVAISLGRIVSLALAMLLAPALEYRTNFEDLYQCRSLLSRDSTSYLRDKLIYLFAKYKIDIELAIRICL